MNLTFVKSNGVWHPADPESEDALRSFGDGEILEVKGKKARNPRFHRKVFSLLQLAFANQESYRIFNHFRRAVTIEAGYFEDLRLIDGTVQREALSLSYASMDEMQFAAFYRDAYNVITQFVFKGRATPALEAQLEEYQW